MTWWLGRFGFGDAPTRAIVCASDRISTGLRTPPGYPSAMADRLRVACVQLNAVSEKADNIQRAEQLVAKAAATGADLVLLPEKWTGIGPPELIRAVAESLDDGEATLAMRGWAKALGITLHGGSLVERRERRDKLSNTTVVIDPEGEIGAVYRKIHLFDVQVGGHVYRESETEEPGDRLVLTEVEGWKLGLTICYDLRFPELYRLLALEGCEALAVPAAFTLYTGKDHWEPLLRARAIENQCYVLAPNQWGSYADGKAAYGRSMIIDPWGVVVAQAPDEDGVITAELDRSRLEEVRRRVPSLANRQPAAYQWPAGV
jgi:deaminated glutathione amidase